MGRFTRGGHAESRGVPLLRLTTASSTGTLNRTSLKYAVSSGPNPNTCAHAHRTQTTRLSVSNTLHTHAQSGVGEQHRCKGVCSAAGAAGCVPPSTLGQHSPTCTKGLRRMLNMNCGKYDRFWCSKKLAGSSFRYSANLQQAGKQAGRQIHKVWLVVCGQPSPQCTKCVRTHAHTHTPLAQPDQAAVQEARGVKVVLRLHLVRGQPGHEGSSSLLVKAIDEVGAVGAVRPEARQRGDAAAQLPAVVQVASDELQEQLRSLQG